MKLPLTSIKIDNPRQRSSLEREKIEELAESISRVGLLHPPVVRIKDGEAFLIAGQRRLEAMKHLGWSETDVRTMQELVDPVDIFEAELDENIRRVDLHWKDRVRTIAYLQRLRESQHGRQPLSATAAEIARDGDRIQTITEEIRDSLILYQHLDDPNIAEAPTAKEAFKALRKKVEREHYNTLASQFDMSSTPHTLLQGDAFEIMPTLTAESFDCIITDPPYFIGADSFGSQSSTGHNYGDDPRMVEGFCSRFFPLTFRLGKPTSHLYVFCSIVHFTHLAASVVHCGWNVWPRPLIWYKRGGMLPRPDHGPRYTYDAILYATKGDRRILHVRDDVLTYPNVDKPRHGAEKPASLIRDLLERSCLPGDVVLDPFMGTGTIFPACNSLRLTGTGIELNTDNYSLAVGRISERVEE